MKKKIKLVAAVALALIGLVIILQNTDEVNTRILWITVTMPRAVLLLVSVSIGFGLGFLAARWGPRRAVRAGSQS